MGYLRDAFIAKMQSTPSGAEYLQKCIDMNETKSDKVGISKFVGGGNG